MLVLSLPSSTFHMEWFQALFLKKMKIVKRNICMHYNVN